jgi:hypothetical protein
MSRRICPGLPAGQAGANEEAFEQNRRRKESGVRGEEKKSPMLGLVARAMEEMVRR